MSSPSITERAKKVRLVVLDVDGVLTDGSIWTGENGESVKRFFTRDGLGIKMLQWSGIPVAVLTGRISAQTAARCRELGIQTVRQGKAFKRDAWRALVAEFDLQPECVAYMGDDIPDIPCLSEAGLAAVPRDASTEIVPLAHWIAPACGGNGAVRALSELILRAQGKWDDLVRDKYVEGVR